MDFIREKAWQIGGFLALIGVVSSVLNFIDYNLRILMWIDMWGATVGWIIRISLIVGGLILMFVGKSDEEDDDDESEN